MHDRAGCVKINSTKKWVYIVKKSVKPPINLFPLAYGTGHGKGYTIGVRKGTVEAVA